MKTNRKESYTAADSFPIKLFHDQGLIKSITENKKIMPRHIQFIPTNRCNLSCDFCSCEKEDRKLEMSWEEAKENIKLFAWEGTKSVTITGGGEPLLHPHINEIIEEFIGFGIKIGLVTNGLLLHKNIHPEILNKVTWCRISNGDFRHFDSNYKLNLSGVIKSCPDVDWAFSHVVSKNPALGEISKIVSFANEHNFTHVRLVADLFETENVHLSKVKESLLLFNINDSKVIYQGRKNPEHGDDCYICYLKPVISADSKVYWCCGTQYAKDIPARKNDDDLCFGTVKEFLEKLKNQKPMDGNICKKCYYMSYNKVLGSMMNDIEHKEFV